jgi:hypothetical protein
MPNAAMMLRDASGGSVNGFYRPIDINHAKVGTVNHTDYPLAVFGTLSYLATVANGGKVRNASGYDVGFFSDSALTTRLDHETVVYNAATGLVEYHVRVPAVSHSSDTRIYMAYGNAAITTDQSNKTGVWDSGFKRVRHLGDGTTLTGADSTSNAGTGTVTGATATAGQMGGAGDMTSGVKYIEEAAVPVTTYPITLSGLVKLVNTGFASNEDRVFLAIVNKTSAGNGWWVGYWENGGTIKIRVVQQMSGAADFVTGVVPTLNTNYHWITAVLNSNGSYSVLFDGSVLTPSHSFSSSTPSGLTHNYIGGMFQSTTTRYGEVKSTVDEARISNVARSADWELACANNFLDLANFVTVGSEIAI